MAKYILHIGRHKSGTSSLQNFLYSNRAVLVTHGYYYPKTYSPHTAHHCIARNFSKKILRSSNDAELNSLKNCLDSLFKEISDKKETILLSSEGFQNCDPNLVARKFDPEKTKVIVYIREQVDYFISSYLQEVHATKFSAALEDSIQKWIPNYELFLTKWVAVFGSENVIVRAYDRSQLLNNNIIDDFLYCIGIDNINDFVLNTSDMNPSIGGALLEFKRLINISDINEKDQRRLFYSLFSHLSAENLNYRIKPLLSIATIDAIREKTFESNHKVFARYFSGNDVFSRPKTTQPNESRVVSIDDLLRIFIDIQAKSPQACDRIVDLFIPSKNISDANTHIALIDKQISDKLLYALQNIIDSHQNSETKFNWNQFIIP